MVNQNQDALLIVNFRKLSFFLVNSKLCGDGMALFHEITCFGKKFGRLKIRQKALNFFSVPPFLQSYMVKHCKKRNLSQTTNVKFVVVEKTINGKILSRTPGKYKLPASPG